MHSLRKGRWSEAGRIYLITTVADARRPLFRRLIFAREVVGAMHRASAGKTLCYCLMPDHLHWLLELKSASALSDVVQAVKSVTSRRIKARMRHPPARIWQPGFHDRALRSEDDLAALARYIVANPLRAGLVRRLADYPHWDAIWL